MKAQNTSREEEGLKSTKIYCFTDWTENTMLLHHKDQAKKSTTFFIKAQEPLSIESILHSKGKLGHWVTRPTFQPPTKEIVQVAQPTKGE